MSFAASYKVHSVFIENSNLANSDSDRKTVKYTEKWKKTKSERTKLTHHFWKMVFQLIFYPQGKWQAEPHEVPAYPYLQLDPIRKLIAEKTIRILIYPKWGPIYYNSWTSIRLNPKNAKLNSDNCNLYIKEQYCHKNNTVLLIILSKEDLIWEEAAGDRERNY